MTPNGVPPTGKDGSPTSRRQGGDNSSNLPSMIIFVFGSNLAGINGAGAAKFAVKHHGAVYTKNVTAHWGKVGKYGVGLQGNAYAIPTKDEFIKTLPLDRIQPYIEEFIQFAVAHPEMTFNVTKIGCGLAGYTPAQIGPMFADALKLTNVNLPIEFGGTRDVFTDKNGEEVSASADNKKGDVASADASATGSSTDPNLSGMVINNNNTPTDDSAVEIHHAGWTDADGVGATTPAIEAMENVCSKCGFCGPHRSDGYCQNKVTGPHLSKWGKRLKTMQMNDDLLYGDGDKVYVRLDTVSGMSSRERQLESKLHTNEKGDLIQGLNLGEKEFRVQASKDEIAKAENKHIHRFGCPCVKCTCGGIAEFDENGDPTGATAAQPLGMGDSFVEPRNNIFHKSAQDVYKELKAWINSNGIKGIDPVIADYMMRYENRRMIAHALIEYAPHAEWMQVHSNKRYSHNGGFVTKKNVPQKPVEQWLDNDTVIINRLKYKVTGRCNDWCSAMHETRTFIENVPEKKSAVDTPPCAPYHEMRDFGKITNCTCTPRKQPTIFYTDIVYGVPDEDGKVAKYNTFLSERQYNARIPERAIVAFKTSHGNTTEYIPERETYENYSYLIPTLSSFVTGEKASLHIPYPPAGTKDQIESGDPRLVGTVKGPCKCEKSGKLWQKDPKTKSEKFPDGINYQCDCEYEDLEIAKGDWNSTHVMSNDPVKGKSASLGDLERKKIWYRKWYNRGKEPYIPNYCPEGKWLLDGKILDQPCWHSDCQWYYSKKNPDGPNYPKETTGWQRTFCKEKGVILPDNYTYDQSYKIVQYLFKDKVDIAKEVIALHAAHVEHMKQHTQPHPSFEPCLECGAIYTHQDEAPNGEKPWEITPAEDRVHLITDYVPYQELEKRSETITVESQHSCEPLLKKNSNGIVHTPRQEVKLDFERWVKPKSEKQSIGIKFDDVGTYVRNDDVELAIVGSSEFHKNGKAYWKEAPAREEIVKLITAAKEVYGYRIVNGKKIHNLVVSSGGAIGVDTIAEEVADELGVRTHIYRPDVNQFPDGEWNKELGRIEIGYKTRDLMIASKCCKLINIIGEGPKKAKIYKGRTRKVMCKHCNLPHYSSGGCYTAKKAFWLGKNAETIAV